MNRLSGEQSPYLRHSASQKIDWYPWSDEAFEKAKRENKAVFLSSGAIWCHWCHVMAKESFENDEIVNLLNENFVCIKLDSDERPDIDRRYQQVVAAMGAGGGWPLSVFLTPDRKPFFGGTYFPPEDRVGRPGFKRILKEIADLYRLKKKEIFEFSQKLLDYLKPQPLLHGEIEESSIDDALKDILSQFDPRNGGFGLTPKFPMPGIIELLINKYFFTQKESIGYALRKTLESMARGGFHDQIGGGFHRYSVDEAWIIPHFEKMADDNAWLLRNYINAYQVFGNEYFKEVAKGIVNFIDSTLSNPAGGFYASQDADVTPDDEGGYFTWTEDDLRRILNDEEYRILSMHFIHDRGTMHHDKSKKVLFVAMDAGEIARKKGMDIQKVSGVVKRGKRKLLEERNKRKAPFIDMTCYTSLNGMLITAYLKASKPLKNSKLKDFALKSLSRILADHFINNELLHTQGIKAILDDYIYLIEALVSSYEVTGDKYYTDQADKLMELCLEKFCDKEQGGFFDTDREVLGIRLKAIEDIPHPSANALSIILMLKLYAMTEREKYHLYAQEALKAFSLKAKYIGMQAGYYYCALDAYSNMMKLTLHTKPADKLAEIALSSFYPYMSIAYGEDRGYALPCVRETCYGPIDNPDRLRDFLSNQQKILI